MRAGASGESAWPQTFDREAGIRSAVVVSGNTGDVAWSLRLQSYQPVFQVLVERLRKRGFDDVVRWDGRAQVTSDRPGTWDELNRSTLAASPAAERGSWQTSGGEDYLTGDDASAQAGTTETVSDVHAPDFFTVVRQTMVDPTRARYAFVVDFTDLLFTANSSASEAERLILLLMSQAVRQAPVGLNSDQLQRPDNLLVLVCGGQAGLPSILARSSPAVGAVRVPLPDRKERERFIGMYFDRFQLLPQLRPGSPRFEDFIDSLEGMGLRDLQQLVKLSWQGDDRLTQERLVNLYRYGERRSPWEDLSQDKLRGLEEALRARVKGQESAIAKVRRVVIRAYTGLAGLQHSSRQQTPKGVLFFVGPTGVGKTELAKALAEFLFGEEEACIRFDMSEFNHEHSDQRLVGAPPGYVGFEQGGQLTNAVKARPFSVLLFDEVEKAHQRVLDKFLQILEDGRLTDGRGETVHFSETVIIFTSNIGAATVPLDSDEDAVSQRFTREVQKHFIEKLGRPELLNRIGDNIVPFGFIASAEHLTAIARAKLSPFRKRLREKYKINEFRFRDEEKALRAIVGEVDRAQGGRGVRNALETHLVDPLADFLFDERASIDDYAGMDVVVCQAGDTSQLFFLLEEP